MKTLSYRLRHEGFRIYYGKQLRLKKFRYTIKAGYDLSIEGIKINFETKNKAQNSATTARGGREGELVFNVKKVFEKVKGYSGIVSEFNNILQSNFHFFKFIKDKI